MQDDSKIASAAAQLCSGGVIAYPTEAVWGLGCDPFHEVAVLRLLTLKQRSVAQGLILVAASVEQLDGFVDWNALDAARRKEVRATWPGPHTWIVPATPRVPRWITGDHDGVAVRVSAHATVVALCRAFSGPLVSTSANRSGFPAPTTRAELDPAIAAAVDMLVDGSTGGLARPTPIRDARSGRELRT